MTNTIIIAETAGVLDYEAKTPIENFSHVVRVNSGWDVGFSQHVGNRIDTLVLNPWFVHVPEKRNAIQTKPSYPEIGKILIAPSSGVEYSMPENISELFPNKEVTAISHSIFHHAIAVTKLHAHFSIYLAALHYLELEGAVTVYGFNPEKYTHFWEDYSYPCLNGRSPKETLQAEKTHLQSLGNVTFLEDTL